MAIQILKDFIQNLTGRSRNGEELISTAGF